MEIKNENLWIKNSDCIDFLKEIPDYSVDLILTDPPFGLGEKKFDDLHYARNNKTVVNGYKEAPNTLSYEDWTYEWISEFNRILKKNGSIFIVSGWTNEADIQYAFRRNGNFRLINHLIWNYTFGVYTSSKFVTSHYHILYYAKKEGKQYFNKNAYHDETHKNKKKGSCVYDDLQDVIKINKEYKPNQEKNCNTLPMKLIEKLIKHTTKPGDVVLDIFSGGFTTEFASLKLRRKAWGCEINKNSCKKYFPILKNYNDFYETEEDIVGYKKTDLLVNQGKPLTNKTKKDIVNYFNKQKGSKKERIANTANHFKRGTFSISRVIKSFESKQY